MNHDSGAESWGLFVAMHPREQMNKTYESNKIQKNKTNTKPIQDKKPMQKKKHIINRTKEKIPAFGRTRGWLSGPSEVTVAGIGLGPAWTDPRRLAPGPHLPKL
ncbi:hypothetical protein METBIDRAFT_31210 [Metschnikowia bicuspidata var. bicuspidata NRRL YB-4993]|uniref:Uncharacterized protein n=1 Tax=Metschnikowia bicuspidata var. bicuspidata NRRL YB-4993 TaxID=869754 RepID=A0A1A0HE74_9ASCO|nr:hypothetical protein METBIDRAFT_31210 [Metschnikowia bicuspidata var. bicuspidata NRRL YB-4993]OBA22290.1 hypothetical protein METBIDRAFT_31210 [Metschnikowia bicuspidata var. bicuspidata NRRL YB-4993]